MIPADHRFVKAIGTALRHRCGARAGSHVLVATSGGADSVALLRAIALLAPRNRWRLALTVAHVQHHLRDADGAGEADARLVEDLARGLQLPFRRADLDLDPGRRNLEARARDGRYEALESIALAVGAPQVAVAHHGDDQLETILMRMLRGASVRGLRAMPWRRPIRRRSPVALIRPMLAVDRAAARGFLQALGQPWREDRTNADRGRLRAFLRAEIVPALRRARPEVARRATVLAGHMRALCALLDERADLEEGRLALRVPPGTRFERAAARDLAPVVLQEVLRRALRRAGAGRDGLGRRAIDPVVRAVRDRRGGTRRFQLANGVSVTVTRCRVEVAGR